MTNQIATIIPFLPLKKSGLALFKTVPALAFIYNQPRFDFLRKVPMPQAREVFFLLQRESPTKPEPSSTSVLGSGTTLLPVGFPFA